MTKEPRPHPDHEWLLLMSDGELPLEARAAMQKHLEACWECRHELQRIEEAIGHAVRYRKEVLARHLPPPPNAWRDLAAGFAGIDRELAPPSVLSRMAATLTKSPRMPRYAVPLAAAAALGASLFVFVARTNFTSEPAASVIAPAEPRPLDVVKPKAARVPSSEVPTAAASASAPSFATADELAVSAVRVFAVLHEREADLGEPIEVLRRDGRVVVRGFGLDPARTRDLEAALNAIPLVELRLKEMGAPAVNAAVDSVAVTPGAPPFESELQRALGGQGAVDAWTSDVLEQAETLMIRAHALRRIGEAFGQDRLDETASRTVAAMRRDHARVMAADVKRLQRTLASALRTIGGSAALPAARGEVTESSVFAAARRLEDALAELAGAKPLSGERETLPGRVATGLAELSALAQTLAERP